MEKSRTCEICNVNVHRASMQKHLRNTEKLLENMIHDEIIIPEWLFKEEKAPIENKIKKVYNPKTLKQMDWENIKMIDKELDREIAKNMIHPYYFIDRDLRTGLNINLDSHNNNLANSILTITRIFPEFVIEFRYIKKFKKNCLFFTLD